jgi:hypothetical protein
MKRRTTAVTIVAAALCLGASSVLAGPCTSEIAWFEQAVRQSAGQPNAGPMARQTVAAQLGEQPTPASIRRAQRQAQAAFQATMARAERLDARGDASCNQALAAAKGMYNLR